MLAQLAVFVSGSGSNLQAIIDAIQDGQIKGATIKIVIASNANAYALERAKQSGIDTLVFEKKDYQSPSVMFESIIKVLQEKEIDYIVLAGYLTILTPNIINAFRNKIINIHPSLIPAYCGDGYYGIKVHQAVIEAKEKKTGVTVHFVDEGTDTGAIIMQEAVQVLAGDNAETLQKRVLLTEHQLLPKAINYIVNRRKE